MRKSLFVVMLTVGMVSTARADRVTLSTLGWTLDISGHDPWTATTKSMNNVTTDVVALGAGYHFKVRLARDATAVCAPSLIAIATEMAQRRENIHVDKPISIPTKPWYPALVSLYQTLSMTRVACRDLAGGGALLAVIESPPPLQGKFDGDAKLAQLFAALDDAVRANKLDKPLAVTGDPVKPIADAIAAAQSGPQTITIPELGTLTIPKSWDYYGGSIAERRGAVPNRVEPRVYATDIDCAHGMAPMLDDEHIVPVPSDTPGYQVAVMRQSTATSGTAALTWYGLCADIPGGVLIVAAGPRPATGFAAEHAAIIASVLRIARDAARPALPPTRIGIPQHASPELPRAAGAWRSDSLHDGSFGVELRKAWPMTAHPDSIVLVNDSEPCTGSQTFPFQPDGWRGIEQKMFEDSKTGAPVPASDFELCAMASDGKRLRATVHSVRDVSGDRAAQLRAVLETIGTAIGVAPSAPPAPASTAYTPPPSYTPDASTNTPDASTYTPTPAYTPDTYDSYSYTPHHRSRKLGELLHGVSLSLHQLDARTTGVEDGYGASLGYGRVWHGKGAGTMKLDLAAGYDSTSGALLDGQLALGWSIGEPNIGGAGIYGVLGGDGIGVGQDAAADRMKLPGDVYYGVRVELAVGSTDFRIAYLPRSGDAVPHETRLEIGYRLHGGSRLAFGYRGLDKSGRFITLGLGL